MIKLETPMIKLEALVRPNILELKGYSSARDEYKGSEGIFLDANENPYGNLNRYPDPQQTKLKELLADLKAVDTQNIFIGNGSDEIIDLAFRIFCTPGEDRALTFSPTYGMYDVSAAINDIKLIKSPLTKDFQIELASIDQYIEDDKLKLIFICSPNNPTGNSLDTKTIEIILKRFKGIVIIDEAYIDFAKADSMISLINRYQNLIVSQTMSKAWGLAAARIGIAYANQEIIQIYNKVKPPYNVSKPNQEAAINTLKNLDQFNDNVDNILKEKESMVKALSMIKSIKKIYPSDTNFFLIEVEDADLLYQQLISDKIIIRNRNSVIANCLRISIGTKSENDQLINALKTYQ